MMNKKIAALAAALALGVAGTASAEGSSVSIKFTGKIVNTTCEIGVDNSSAAIDLGTYPVGFFVDQDTTTDAKQFNLKISGCKLTNQSDEYSEEAFPVNRIHLTFTDNGGSGTRTSGLLNLSEGSGAEHVGIGVQYKNSNQDWTNVFEQDGTSEILVSAMTVDSIGSDNQMIPMQAYMKPNNATNMPTAGEVNGQMTVTLSYE